MTVAISISPTQSDLQRLLGAFLVDVLPPNTSVIGAQPNQVAEPKNPNFVMMMPTRFERLETNIDSVQDVRIVGSISGSTLAAASVRGNITIGAILFGPTVPRGTKIIAQDSGAPGGSGTYEINSNLTVPANSVFSAGLKTMTQKSVVTVQLDFHAASYLATDMAQTVSTAFRDEYATRFFKAFGLPITPLYADDPGWRPFVNAEKQYEWRWVIEAKLQIDQSIMVPQEFADSVALTLLNVDAVAPPVPPSSGPSLDYSQADNSQYQPGLGA